MSSPDDLESTVLELVKEFLTKKSFFSINEMVDYINYRVRLNPNINRNKIELILKSLIRKRVIIPGTRLMKNNIIENPKRNKIFNYIKKNPANINEIMKALNIGSNHALWHLSCLEKFQFVRSKKIGNRRVFFIYDSDPEFDDLNYYLRVEIVRDIINFMKNEKKAVKITEIATNLKKNHSTVKKYVDILKSLNLIRIEKEKGRDTLQLDTKNYSKVKKLILGA